MIREITDGLTRAIRVALDPDYDPDQEERLKAQRELQMAMIRLAVAMIRAQRISKEEER